MAPLLGCSVAATRPVQEMAIASAALRAAREVNADALENSNVPDLYRAAADALYRAKKEYRLKNFDLAKKYALKATVIAEKAEFEALKAGGATPEAAAARLQNEPEGAPQDPSLAEDRSINANQVPGATPLTAPSQPEPSRQIASGPPASPSDANESDPSATAPDKQKQNAAEKKDENSESNSP